MAYDLEEQESIDQFKAWWEKWGNLILSVVTVVLLCVAAFNGWRWYKTYTAAKAGAAYSQMAPVIVEGKDTDRIARMATAIFEDYGSTVYAPLAGLQAASALNKAGKPEQARTMLERVIEVCGSDHEEISAVAGIRLAGLALDAGKLDQALAALDKAKAHGMGEVIWHDRRGDVLFAMGKKEDARAAWAKADSLAPADHPMKALINLKLTTLLAPKAQG